LFFSAYGSIDIIENLVIDEFGDVIFGCENTPFSGFVLHYSLIEVVCDARIEGGVVPVG
jgi:hypothetical protein